jgi:hypothetical protein
MRVCVRNVHRAHAQESARGCVRVHLREVGRAAGAATSASAEGARRHGKLRQQRCLRSLSGARARAAAASSHEHASASASASAVARVQQCATACACAAAAAAGSSSSGDVLGAPVFAAARVLDGEHARARALAAVERADDVEAGALLRVCVAVA